MNALIRLLTKLGLLKDDLDYHVVRASMIIMFLFFGYTKWFDYAVQTLVAFISNGPLTSWMYPVFGVRWGTRFLGISEWSFALLLSWDSGTRSWEYLGPLVRPFRSQRPSPSFPSYQMPGPRLPAGFRQ
jgi:hypothetical protein